MRVSAQKSTKQFYNSREFVIKLFLVVVAEDIFIRGRVIYSARESLQKAALVILGKAFAGGRQHK